jgi:serine/threonine protein kinase
MGEVYEAQDRELQRRVAVKVFRSGADERDRFRIEAVTLAGLSHPGLVRVFDAGEHDGDAFVVLELVDGPSLARRLREQGAATPGEAAAIGARVADALAHVHAGGVVHRDVTPSNILCGPDGRPKLADFGIARLIDSARVTAPAMAVGTAAYMAPEQVLGEDVTPAADIYSLGLVLLEMLTGSRAYDGPSREAAVARLVRPPSLPDDLPRGWRRLIQDMTGGDPSSRRHTRGSGSSAVDRRSASPPRQRYRLRPPLFAGMAATAPEAPNRHVSRRRHRAGASPVDPGSRD